ncbi:TetR/AcrR family transcriptional regulator [Roseateles cellulosilyticus]|uniref:TetR/AcrR family transcriptional regulator n=1 Tax=Pelomonas cellulosilytica TaxID=2906762 RepID=A0ABS8XZU3_9BURK|nr:TetR/AcrR family transcriptional regulator [Pelomonas sp. P8]MCE4557513.1 TetR/AcrR family transcriptional regulator [Pelomonas sp. P8]
MSRPSFREQVQQARQEAVVDAVERLLADKGFDAMTMDAVVAEVGISKASLYRHFTSKEQLAAAAMARVLERALAETARLSALPGPALGRLDALARWAYEQQIAGRMPALPAQSSSLRDALAGDTGYTDRLVQLTNTLGQWIAQAQRDGHIDPALPSDFVLYTLFARACDPVLGVMRTAGTHGDAQIVDWLVRSWLRGLRPEPTP